LEFFFIFNHLATSINFEALFSPRIIAGRKQFFVFFNYIINNRFEELKHGFKKKKRAAKRQVLSWRQPDNPSAGGRLIQRQVQVNIKGKAERRTQAGTEVQPARDFKSLLSCYFSIIKGKC